MLEIKDNVLTKQKQTELFTLVATRPYIKQELDTFDQPLNERSHTYNFTELERGLVLERIMPLLGDTSGLEATRVYANAFMFGDTPRFHTDSEHPEAKTALYYPNLEWEPRFGAETLFLLKNNVENNGILTAICPVPNRLVIFNGNLLHSARPPLYQGLIRYSIAIKLEPTNTFKTPGLPVW